MRGQAVFTRRRDPKNPHSARFPWLRRRAESARGRLGFESARGHWGTRDLIIALFLVGIGLVKAGSLPAEQLVA
jgi:hypothetical protein